MLVPPEIHDKIPHLPESPGVYLWKDAAGVVLYVGKAKKLRSRVRTYVTGDHHTSPKTRALMSLARELDTVVVASETQALVLEATLIREYKPRFNIRLRNEREAYPYIRVTLQEPFPRIMVTRTLAADGARYFGPYPDVGSMRRTLDVVKRLFTVRSCDYDMPTHMPERACLDFHIGRCKAPCVFLQSQADYRAMIDEVVAFLGGKAGDVPQLIRERMARASELLDYEHAALLRDALAHVEQMDAPNTVMVKVEGGDRDVIGFARDGEHGVVSLLRVRGGVLLGRESHFLHNLEGESDGAAVSAYLAGPYRALTGRATELVLPFEVPDAAALEEVLAGARLLVPQRGPRRELADLAEQNARHLLEEERVTAHESAERAADPVYELQRQLGLEKVPRSFVCFDISHAQGTDVVASCVWFQNGRPNRAEYRKFKVQAVEGGNRNNDFASMHEVVGRYFRRRLADGKPLPDLILIDGGKGQLGSAAATLDELGLRGLPIISLAKREEEVFLLGRSDPVVLSRRSPALRMLQQARDEAHRFAVTFQRARRSARTLTSELLLIPGIGDAKRRMLLSRFGSLDGIRAATPAEIASLPGFSEATGARILAALGVPPANDGASATPSEETTLPAVADDGDGPPPADDAH